MAASVFGCSLSGHGRLRCSEHPLRALTPSTNDPPRHFHECGTKVQVPPPTKNHRHSDYLPVILWSPLPSVILRKGTALTKNLFPRKIDVSLTLNMTNDRCLDSLHLFYYSLHDIACKQSLRMLRSSVRLRLLRMRKQRIVNNE